jgi:ATP-dependent DNA helicase RecG
MVTRVLTRDEALKIATTTEGYFFDRKASAVDGRAIQKAVVAFANSDGGDLYIGIADDKHEPDPERRWKGFGSLEDANGILQAAFQLTPSPPVKYEILTSDFPGTVVRINVEKSAQVHKTSDGKVYVRHAAQSIPLDDPQKVVELSFSKGASTFEDAVLPGVRSEIVVDAPLLKTFISRLSPRSDSLDYAFNYNLLDATTWNPRVAGVLLFATHPQSFIPTKCAVKIVRYETREDDPERDHLKESFTVEGPLYEQIKNAAAKITEMMSSVKVWTAGGLGSLNYPPEAIWEVLTNAVIHRDYSIADDVQVRIFDNRIEIQSPGKLPGYVKIESILGSRYSRNPKIVRTLNWFPDPPNKDLGEGLDTAFQKMKEWGLRNPEIREDGNYVVVVLPHSPLATPADAILRFLVANDQIVNRQARDLTGMKSENQVKNEFYKLRDEGYIERVPGLEGNKAAWRLTPRGQKYVHG